MGKQKIKKMDLSQVNFTPIEGEIMQNAANGKYYIWHEDGWHEFNMSKSGLEIGLYDMNKQIISQLPALTNILEKQKLINNFSVDTKNTYYMLYGKEISYFTLFKIKEYQYFGAEVVDCLKYIGIIKAIDLTEANDAIEIWIENEDGPTCLYLFPYDTGVVQVGE